MLFKAVLIADKRPEQSVKYKKILEGCEDVTVLIANDIATTFKLLNEFEPDLLLISDSLETDIGKVIEQIRVLTYNSRPDIIALSKSSHIQDKIDILDAGADDFISEPVHSDELKARITAHLRRNLENCFSEKTLLFNSKISYKMIKRSLNEGGDIAIMLTDIDNFASYKEIYGELAAEKLLQTFAAIIKSATEKTDYVGQLSNEDFIVITQSDKAEMIANYLVFAFDTVVSKFYSESDAKRGFMFLHGDDVAEDKVKLVSASIGVITNKFTKYTDTKQVITELIKTHKLAQSQKGSSYIIKRPEITTENSIGKPEKNMTLMIAEPDESLSVLLEASARLQGYNVVIVESYDEIKSAVKEYNPFAVILDAGKTGNMRGLDICTELKFHTENFRSNIILTTTLHDKEPVLNAGADLYLPKPYELSVLFGKIKKFNDDFNNI